MAKVEKILTQMRQNPKNVRFTDLCRVCDHFFGEARQSGAVIEYIKLLGKAIHE